MPAIRRLAHDGQKPQVLHKNRGACTAGQLAELVKDKQIGARVAAETTLEGGQRFLAEKIGEHRGEGREPDGEAGRQCGLGETSDTPRIVPEWAHV